jgi:uncharacterized protein
MRKVYRPADHMIRNHILGILLALIPVAVFAAPDMQQMVGMAQAGNAKAQYELGVYWSQTVAAEHRDYARAVDWYRRAALQNHLPSAYNLALLLKSQSPRTAQNYQEARRWFTAAAQAGNAQAAYELANLMNRTSEQAEYRQWLKQAATLGDARAMDQLGTDIQRGFSGFRQDLAAGAAWHRRAAEGGSVMGMHNWAVDLSGGFGVDKDLRAYVLWLRQAASKGSCLSIMMLGAAYEDGEGVGQSDRYAVQLYEQAAQMGNAHAIKRLANAYATGSLGLPQDADKARTVQSLPVKQC